MATTNLTASKRLNEPAEYGPVPPQVQRYDNGVDVYQPNDPTKSYFQQDPYYNGNVRVTRSVSRRQAPYGANADRSCEEFYQRLFKAPADTPIEWSADGTQFGDPTTTSGGDETGWSYDESFWAKGSQGGELKSMLGDSYANIETMVIPYICENRQRADEIINNIAEILNALMDRLAATPGLLHTNNMLLMRNQVLDRDADRLKKERTTFKEIRTRLLGEQRSILEQVMVMAKQIHRLHSGLTSAQLTALQDPTNLNDPNVPGINPGAFGLGSDRLYALKNILAGVVTGQIMGMPLAGGNRMPAVTLTFDMAALPPTLDQSALQQQVRDVLSNLATTRIHDPITAGMVKTMVSNEVEVKANLDSGKVHLDISSGTNTNMTATEANNAFLLATLMVELAVDHDLLKSGSTEAAQLYANAAGNPELNLESLDVREITSGRADGRVAVATGGAAPIATATVPRISVTIDDNLSSTDRDAVILAMYGNLPAAMIAGTPPRVSLDAFRASLRTQTGVQANMSFWGNVGKFFRGESIYAANTQYYIDMEALMALADLTEPPDMSAFVAGADQIPNVTIKETVGEDEEEPAVVETSNEDVAGGLGSVKLEAEVDSKQAQLDKIRKMINSNEVKEFIRVRPYNDKDERATELQLGTIGKDYERSSDDKVAIGQLKTKIKYAGSCMDFTAVFEKQGDDRYFEPFQGFIPKAPKKEQWFASVNGSIFPEFMSYQERGISVIPSAFLTVRKHIDLVLDYEWVPYKHPETGAADPSNPNRKWVQPKKSIAEIENRVTAMLKEQVTGPDDKKKLKYPEFVDTYRKWKGDVAESRGKLEVLIPNEGDADKKARFQNKLNGLPQPTDAGFATEFVKTRVASDSINIEFVDTVWPVLQVFFGPPSDPSDPNSEKLYNDTKNVVAFFYGASGSGKTFTAEAILNKVFETIKEHPDQFVFKIVADYNNTMYDYYSKKANVKLVHNNRVLNPSKSKGPFYNGKKAMNRQTFGEMANRAKLLTFKDGQTQYEDFFEGNVSPEHKIALKRPATKPISLDNLGTYTSVFGTNYESLEVTDALATKGNKFTMGKEIPIPKDTNEFKMFKKDYETRVAQFRSVTDTGLNPESSRSHLLYIVQRKTKNGGTAMTSTEKGALFVLADFAGTENLNYLMTDNAWKQWLSWPGHKTKDGGKGVCEVGGKQVEPGSRDWSCIDLPVLANGKSGTNGITTTIKKDFRAALVNGWRAIKLKTLVSTDIADMATVPTDKTEMEKLREMLTKKWTDNLSKPYVTAGNLDKDGTDLELDKHPENASRGHVEYFSVADLTAADASPFLKSLRTRLNNSLGELSLVPKPYETDLNMTTAKANQTYVDLNPYRFATHDDDRGKTPGNDSIIVNMVLAMHAESKHINDSLKEIADLVNAQRAATTNNPEDKADLEKLKKENKLTKIMVMDILAPAVVAGSTVVTYGAINPRRTGDFDSWGTMDNITAMRASCSR